MKLDCELEPAAIKRNKEVAILFVFIGIVMSLLYSQVLNYLEKVSKIDFKQWDLNTCTVADYSIKLQLPEQLWSTYLDRKAEDQETRPFDQYIRETFE